LPRKKGKGEGARKRRVSRLLLRRIERLKISRVKERNQTAGSSNLKEEFQCKKDCKDVLQADQKEPKKRIVRKRRWSINGA